MLLDSIKHPHSKLCLGEATDVEPLMSWMWICGWLFTPALLITVSVTALITLLLEKYIKHRCLEPRSALAIYMTFEKKRKD